MDLKLEQPNLQYATELGLIDINQIEDSTVFSVEIFPPNQSKESFEEAEFNNFIDISREDNLNPDFMELKYYPKTWTREQYCEINGLFIQLIFSMLGSIKNLEDFKGTNIYEELRVIRNKYNDDYCAYCGCELNDSNRRQNEHEITVCEDCFISEQERKLQYANKFKTV